MVHGRFFDNFLRISSCDRHFFYYYCGGNMYLHGTMEDVCKYEINLEGDSAFAESLFGFIPGLKPKHVQ